MNISQWKVLVVEDTEDDVTMLSKILHYHGIQVFVARDGQQCMNLLQDVLPHLVIMDLAMPGMDGWQTLAAIRADARLAHLPVVAATAYYSAELNGNAYTAGFDAYFEKPLNPRSLVDHLATLIQPER